MLLHSRDRELRLRRWAIHSDEEVAAGGGSGSSWRARTRPGKEGNSGGEKQGATRGHVQKLEVELGVLCWQSAVEAEWSRGGSGGDRGRRKQTGVRRTHSQIEKLPGTPL
jgi:hypothetical protein